MMRFFSILILNALCLFAVAQSSTTTPIQDEEVRRWRIGISLQSDNGFTNPYIRTSVIILPLVDRKDAVVFAADYQIFAKLPILFVTSEFSIFQGTAGNDDFRWLAANDWPGEPFLEHADIRYLHAGLGLRIEPLAKRRFSPYLGWQLHVSVPRRLEYAYESFSRPGFGPVEQLDITGGRKINQGWKFNAGLRAKLHPRWSASLGVYHAYMAFSSKWAGLAQRQFLDNVFMRLDIGGVEFRCQYSI
ncbi:MAG: hypothetical protein AAFP77_09270 [Bacteroidota bacterium]